ncbi:uncharacterized protein KY384_000892 [Bacidia gigantensis]|uniref:uncharacterized protein n=1 Tax=Bacidia gigantensis TaxID=2732470 RepID=UPI001D054890|nr:uncharacterized protein KY384_000892 [Bacidia gigantensis]KAG8534049.1 hypothetical protein KY384_000892 [Bacidia gigantensis]
MSTIEETITAPKPEPYEEEDFSDSDQEPDGQNHNQEPAQVQKRKGGRKPIYATSEERKQRNRQAQAAFRERRTEYIKQLETTIKHHEETLQSLQQSHRSAADECLMLRYKNSLLERILLEKGIDVQAELRLKTEGSHVLSHPASGSAAPQSSAVQRAVMNRNSQARRPTASSIAKPIRPQQFTQPPRSHSLTTHTPSPLSASRPMDGIGRGMLNDKNQRPQHPIQPRTQPQQAMNNPNMSRPNLMHPLTPTSNDGSRTDLTNPGTQPNYYPPEYQAHLEQLGESVVSSPPAIKVNNFSEQEYDAHANMLEDEIPSDTSTPGSGGPSPYPQNYQPRNVAPGTAIPMGLQGAQQINYMPMPSSTSQPSDPQMYGMPNMGFDPNDPALDADPFGLTASMHFPTQFTYQEGALVKLLWGISVTEAPSLHVDDKNLLKCLRRQAGLHASRAVEREPVVGSSLRNLKAGSRHGDQNTQQPAVAYGLSKDFTTRVEWLSVHHKPEEYFTAYPVAKGRDSGGHLHSVGVGDEDEGDHTLR